MALVGAGCNPLQQAKTSIENNVIENAVNGISGGKVKVDSDKGQVSFSNGSGTAAYGSDVSIPSDFPKDMYVYAGATATIVSQSSSDNTAVLGLHTTAASDVVISWYEKKYADSGWKQESTMNLGQMSIRSYVKDGITISTTFIPEYGDVQGTTINLTRKEK